MNPYVFSNFRSKEIFPKFPSFGQFPRNFLSLGNFRKFTKKFLSLASLICIELGSTRPYSFIMQKISLVFLDVVFAIKNTDLSFWLKLHIEKLLYQS